MHCHPNVKVGAWRAKLIHVARDGAGVGKPAAFFRRVEAYSICQNAGFLPSIVFDPENRHDQVAVLLAGSCIFQHTCVLSETVLINVSSSEHSFSCEVE